ncbi:hypothetical protein MCAP1_002942 [Malassezia caprae]|uniref:Uncharacterized protein n=1 Tax=Malassezia caprae TaxID=1381934 RepID=A0AAF0IWJ0_9BASI|nr:hypothetical protein MCAP1_002942 [Malassezia caprae]
MPAESRDLSESLWSLVLDLSAQVTANQQIFESLKKQLEDLQGQAIHAKTGYALRRFNVDLSQEAFLTQLERLNVQLANENTLLSHESKQLGTLLRECESTLETVMGKFRAFSHAAQQHGLDLSAYYESRLEAQTRKADAASERENYSMYNMHHRLGDLVRGALQSFDGEDELSSNDALEHATELEHLRHENEMLRLLLGMRLEEDETAEATAERSSATDLSVSRTQAQDTSEAAAPSLPIVDEVDAGVPASSN